MLKGIPEIISPELLYILASMGHGDRIVIADEFYPAVSKTESNRVVYAKGISAEVIINAIIEILPLDLDFSDEPILYMVSDDYDEKNISKAEIHQSVAEMLIAKGIDVDKIRPKKRRDFYKLAQKSYATVSTSEQSPYGCFILQKGLK